MSEDPGSVESTGERRLKDHVAPRRRLSGALRELSFVAVIALIVLTGRSTLADHYYVPSGSMRPTVEVGDRIFVNKLAFGVRLPFTEHYLAEFRDPRPGDVVVLDSPVEDKVLLKRVVAKPGDEVQVRAGRLIINGQPIPVETHAGAELESLGSHLHQILRTYGGGDDFGPVTLPARRYLVLGDNRGESRDGRSFGFVERDAILGRAIAVYMHDGRLSWRDL